MYDSGGNLTKTIPLAFFVEDVAPSLDGNYLYLARGNETPTRLKWENGNYTEDMAWKLGSYKDAAGVTMNEPTGNYISTDKEGNVYIAEGEWSKNGTQMVIKYGPTGGASVASFKGIPSDSKGKLSGLAVNSDGKKVYTTEVNGTPGTNNAVHSFDSTDGKTYTRNTAATIGGLYNENEACSYVADGTTISPPWEDGFFSYAYDVALDEQGNVYVVNTTCNEVLKFNNAGVFQTGSKLGTPPPKPHGFAVSKDGSRIYIGESGKKMTLPTVTTPTDCQSATKSSEGVTGTGAWATPLKGTSGDDVIVGTSGNDLIEGLGGKDLLCGKGGYDTFRGGPGDDTIDGEDTSNAIEHEGGGAPAVGVNVDLAAGTATGHGSDKLLNINEVYGTPYKDVMIGDAKQNYLDGRGGDDSLNGGDGSDGLVGGSGSDQLNSRDGVSDQAWGGVKCGEDTGGGDTDSVTADAMGVDTIAVVAECESIDYAGTDTNAPTVTSVKPTSGQTSGVLRNTNVTATFSEEMKSDTITTSTVTLHQKYWYQVKKKRKGKIRRVWTYRWVPVSASVSCDNPCKTATLDPSSDLLANTTYWARVTTGAKDKAGNALAQNYSWTFTTGSS